MKTTKVCALFLMCSAALACSGGSSSSGGGTPDASVAPDGASPGVAALSQVGRSAPYEPCETNADCGDGLTCFDLLGSKVCTVVGCANGTCPGGAPCVVSDAIAPTGVCTKIVGDPFCGRNCRDALSCNLKPECAARGCCTSLDEQGCPTSCGELETMECEISPQCPEECCR
ncbi:MAG: hypothetical protein AAFN74_00490 [Myxococcota bacterium]